MRRTASGANSAAGVVLSARGDAQASGEVVRDAVDAMSAIERSAEEIGQIVGCSRETVGRILKMLEEQELISAHGKTIVVFGTR